MKHLFLVLSLSFMVAYGSASARTWYITPDGTGDAPTIQAAIDSASAGDTLLLASGTFQGDGNYNIEVPNRPILMRSETGNPEDCTIDCEGHLGFGRYAFQFQSGGLSPVLDGVTIANANANVGAVRCYGSARIRNCIFMSNWATDYGGALFCAEWEPVVKNCTFVSNSAGNEGGAIYVVGVMTYLLVDSCTFYDNQAVSGGAIFCSHHEAVAEIRNSVFYDNSATSDGGAIAARLMWTDISGCTFFANSAPLGSGIAAWCVIRVDSSIVASGVGGCGYYYDESIWYGPYISCTDIYGNEGGDWVGRLTDRLGQDGNFSACPSLCYAEGGDLRLCDESPCLPGNHPDGYDCGLIGAWGEGCSCGPSQREASTWGALKALYE